MRTTKAQISLHIRAVWSASLFFTPWIVYLLMQYPKFQDWLASEAEQAGLSLTWSKTRIQVSRDGAQFKRHCEKTRNGDSFSISVVWYAAFMKVTCMCLCSKHLIIHVWSPVNSNCILPDNS